MIKLCNKYLLTTPVVDMLKRVRYETSVQGDTYLRDIKPSASTAMVTCPFHKNHNERKPACSVFLCDHPSGWKEGQYHCFACNASGDLADLVGACFNEDKEFGEDWLIERFGNTLIEKDIYLPPLEEPVKTEVLDESILTKYDFYHPYMWKRKLSKEVVDQFRVGYDKETQSITFPVYDEHHKLRMITSRSVNSKFFHIQSGVEKPVYLLYDILDRNVRTVYVCESQINTLTLRSWGYDSIGLFGTGSHEQIKLLKRSGIRHFILVFDGDEAGRKGAKRFRNEIGSSVFVTELRVPEGKDVNDLEKEQFEELLNQVEFSS